MGGGAREEEGHRERERKLRKSRVLEIAVRRKKTTKKLRRVKRNQPEVEELLLVVVGVAVGVVEEGRHARRLNQPNDNKATS